MCGWLKLAVMRASWRKRSAPSACMTATLDELQRDPAADLRVLREVDLPHRALAEQAAELEVADASVLGKHRLGFFLQDFPWSDDQPAGHRPSQAAMREGGPTSHRRLGASGS